MKTLPFWLIFLLLLALDIIFFGMVPASADAPRPVVKLGPATQVLVKIAKPYIALHVAQPAQFPWPSRWDIQKPRH